MSKIFAQIRWKALLAVFKLKREVANFMGVRELDYVSKKILIKTSNLREYQTRARSVAKEPQTVEWIEREALKGGIFFDVGANIGAYSLIAGALGMNVYAFEPATYNAATLEDNAELNKLSETVRVLPIALGATTKLGAFTVLDSTSGSSRGFYNEAGEYHLSTEGAKTRAVIALRLDDAIQLLGLPIPGAIKIDVDGGELEVVAGAKETLKAPELRSVLIEVGEGRSDAVSSLILASGFVLSKSIRLDSRTENLIFERV